MTPFLNIKKPGFDFKKIYNNIIMEPNISQGKFSP